MHNIDKDAINNFRYFYNEAKKLEDQIEKRAKYIVDTIAEIFGTKTYYFSLADDENDPPALASLLDLSEEAEDESFTVFAELRARRKFDSETFYVEGLGVWRFCEGGIYSDFYIPKKYLLSTEEEDKIWIKNLKEAYNKWQAKKEEEKKLAKKLAIANKKQKIQRKIDLKKQALNKLTAEERKVLGV